MKRILLCFILLISLGLFSGCTINSVNYVNTEISSIFIAVGYDRDNLTAIGIDTESEILLIKENIELKSSSYMDQMIKKYRTILNVLNSNGYITDNEKIIYKNHLNMYSGWDNGTYIIELRFYTTTASRLFIKYGGETEGAQIENNLFTTNVTEEYTNFFSGTPDHIIATSVSNYFSDSVSNVILANFGELAKDEFNGISVNYMFLSSNSRIHSNGAIVETTEGTLHCFEDSDEGNTFAFCRIEANRYIWYLFALTLTMIFMAIYLIVIYFKKITKIKK